MTEKTYHYGELTITVTNCSDSVPLWDDRGELHPCYHVMVEGGGQEYITSAWGSINDYQRGIYDKHTEMAALVITDMLTDPEEVADMYDCDIEVVRAVANSNANLDNVRDSDLAAAVRAYRGLAKAYADGFWLTLVPNEWANCEEIERGLTPWPLPLQSVCRP